MGKVMVVVLLVFVAVVFTIGSYLMGTYNGFVSSRENVKQEWSQVENLYQRRYDLIPNLVEATRGYAIHERGTFEAVTDARAKVGQINLNAGQLSPAMLSRFQAAQGELSSALSRMMVVVEKYPELKASENFRALMDEVAGTENRIAVGRKRYNEVARTYNTDIKQFPAKQLIAKPFGFTEYPYFEAEKGAEKAPKIDFSDLRQKGTQ